MTEALKLPEIGDLFRNSDETELYRIVLSSEGSIWVDVLDLKDVRFYRNRHYSTKQFLVEMIPFSQIAFAAYGDNVRKIAMRYTLEILFFQNPQDQIQFGKDAL